MAHLDIIESSKWEIYFTAVETVLCILTVVGNSIIIAAYRHITRNGTKDNSAHFFLCNLAIADLIVGLSLPIHIGLYYVTSERNSLLCTLRYSIAGTPLAASLLLLLVITSDRYISVVSPYSMINLQKSSWRYILVTISWLSAIILSLVIPLIWVTIRTDQNTTVTSQKECDIMAVLPTLYWLIIVLPCSYLILFLITVMYIKIFLVARKQIDSIELLTVQVAPADRYNIHHIKLARTGCMLLGVFLSLWLPYIILVTVIISLNMQSDDRLIIARYSVGLLPVLSSVINPVIYAARIRRFRLAIKKLLSLKISNKDKFETYEIRRSFFIPKSKLREYSETETLSRSGLSVEKTTDNEDSPKHADALFDSVDAARKESGMLHVVICRVVRTKSVTDNEGNQSSLLDNQNSSKNLGIQDDSQSKRKVVTGAQKPYMEDPEAAPFTSPRRKISLPHRERLKRLRRQNALSSSSEVPEFLLDDATSGSKLQPSVVFDDVDVSNYDDSSPSIKRRTFSFSTSCPYRKENTVDIQTEKIKNILTADRDSVTTLAELLPVCQRSNSKNGAHKFEDMENNQLAFVIAGDQMRMQVHKCRKKPKLNLHAKRLPVRNAPRFQRSFSLQPNHFSARLSRRH